jgi:hypothetical protein
VHIALLGDSIFDNAAYTGSDPDVTSHLRSLLPREAAATLCAVDGAVVSDLTTQLRSMPRTATHIVVSAGGNDALRHIDLLSMQVSSSHEALTEFSRRIEAFERSYRKAIAAVVATGRPTIICTIYNGRLDHGIAKQAALALALFNDAILRTALALQLDAIELRLVCDAASDYANPIEPSGPGGLKIARAILRAVTAERNAPATRVWI